MRLVWADVVAVEDVDDGLQRLEVRLDDGTTGRAVNYLHLSAPCSRDDRVLVNTTAVDLSLGTGGTHFVVARVGESPNGVLFDRPAGGHVMKLRYTPLQLDVLSVESQESEFHPIMREARDVAGMPVVCCGLHSQVPLVAAAIRQQDPALRVVYCMTDHASLAIALSDVVRDSRRTGLLDATITCGQAFGGDMEAVNLHSGLLAARHVLRADVAVVAIGPGVVGTATPFGHGGICQGEAVNAAGAVRGVPVACLRLSFADARERHRGVSHHTLSALVDVALASAKVPVPALAAEQAGVVDEALDAGGVWVRHERVAARAGAAPAPDMRGVEVRTMGRGVGDDPAFFSAAFAAGEIASGIARGVL